VKIEEKVARKPNDKNIKHKDRNIKHMQRKYPPIKLMNLWICIP
jgi:hypothetical protein